MGTNTSFQATPKSHLASDQVLFVMAAEQEYGPELRRRIQPLITGVGPIDSAISTSLRLQSLVEAGRTPDLVVSLGSAGSRRHEPGTIWQISSVSWRDMDASRLGFEKGVTPYADHAVAIPLVTPVPGVPTASLSTGGDVLGDDDYASLSADLADMETFAVVRACQRFGVPAIGLRGVSDGRGELHDLVGWTDLLGLVDARLAVAVDLIPAPAKISS